jgi:hypothetical protein
MPDEPPSASLDRELTSRIVAAYVRRGQIASDQLATLISTVHEVIANLGKPAPETEVERTPAVPIRRSVHRSPGMRLARPYAQTGCRDRSRPVRRHLSCSLEPFVRSSDDRARLLGAPIRACQTDRPWSRS